MAASGRTVDSSSSRSRTTSGTSNSDDHSGGRPTQRSREQWTTTEPDDQIGALRPVAEHRRKVGARSDHLDGLIQHGRAHTKRRRLQRESLEASAHGNPVRGIVQLGGEHRDASRATDLHGVFVPVAPGCKQHVERQATNPRRD